MDMDLDYPAISDLRARAIRRIPHFVWEYLDSGTGSELAVAENRRALDGVKIMPAVLKGCPDPVYETNLIGRTYARPFGIAPIGMSGLMWPGAEGILASEAARIGIPYNLSTVATRTPDDLAEVVGETGWFQFYPPKSSDVRRDILARAKRAGFHTLVFTVDVPTDSRRERQRRSRLQNPMKITPRILWQVMGCPAWALGILHHGKPRLKLMEEYAGDKTSFASTAHVGYQLRAAPEIGYLRELRDEWDGSLVVKGILDPDDAAPMLDAGADALWVSNHGGRQFEAAPTAVDVLPAIRKAVGPDTPLIADGGVSGGLDILRLIALGADFVMLGRAWHYAVAAFGAKGVAHLAHVLTDDMRANMGQMAIGRPIEARGRVWTN